MLVGHERSFESPERIAHREALELMRFLEDPARHVLELLRSKIDAREYDSVLGDDGGGRIHALLMSKAIGEIYGSSKKLEVVFVQGGRVLHQRNRDGSMPHQAEVREYFARMRPLLGKKTLIVTEEVLSGGSIDTLGTLLRSEGIDADAAVFGAADYGSYLGSVDDEDRGVITTEHGTTMYFGHKWSGKFLSKKELGVLNETRSGSGHAVVNPNQDPIVKRAVRDAARELAHRLAREYLAETN